MSYLDYNLSILLRLEVEILLDVVCTNKTKQHVEEKQERYSIYCVLFHLGTFNKSYKPQFGTAHPNETDILHALQGNKLYLQDSLKSLCIFINLNIQRNEIEIDIH